MSSHRTSRRSRLRVTRSPKSAERRRLPLRLEQLEDRRLFAASWICDSGDWNTASCWSTGAVPGATDDVIIDRPTAVTVTHSSGDHTIKSLTLASGEVLHVTGGSLTVLEASTVAGSLHCIGLGRATFDGLTTVSGNITLNNCSGFNGAGTLTLAAGADLAVGGGVNNLGMRKVIVGPGGQANFAGPANLGGGAEIEVQNNGQLAFLADENIAAGTGGGSINVLTGGRVQKRNSPGTTSVSVPYSSAGTTEVLTGILAFLGGGSSSGVFNVAANTVVRFASVSYTWLNGMSCTGPGTCEQGPGRSTVLGTVGIDNYRQASAAAALGGDGDLVIRTSAVIEGGLQDGNGPTILDLRSNATIQPNQDVILARRWINRSNATLLEGPARLFLNSQWTNEAGAVLTINGEDVLSTSTPRGLLLNSAGGRVNVTATPTNPVALQAAYNSLLTSRFNCQGNGSSCRFQGGGTYGGNFTAGESATVIWEVVAFIFDDTNLSGTGTYQFNTDVTLSGAVTVTNVIQTRGHVSGPGNLTVTQQFTWTGGKQSGLGTTTVNPGATANLIPTPLIELERQLRNQGNLTITGTGQVRTGTGGSVENHPNATLILADNPNLTSSGTPGGFTTEGLTIHQGRVGVTTNVTVPFRCEPGSRLENQSGNLGIRGGGHCRGSRVDLRSNATLIFDQLPFSFGPDTSVTGTGVTHVDTTITTTGQTTVTNLEQTSGSITGTGTLTVLNQFNWRGGAINSVLEVGAGALFNIIGGAGHRLDGGLIRNLGRAIWSGFKIFLGNNAQWRNLLGSVFEIRNNITVHREGTAPPGRFEVGGSMVI